MAYQGKWGDPIWARVPAAGGGDVAYEYVSRLFLKHPERFYNIYPQGCVAQWQSGRLITARLGVRVLPHPLIQKTFQKISKEDKNTYPYSPCYQACHYKGKQRHMEKSSKPTDQFVRLAYKHSPKAISME